METFDVFERKKPFVCSPHGRHGTGVYFTHHRHLCENRDAVEPTAIVHDLQSGTRVTSH